MKILVVDDNANHRRSAEILLKEHEVTIVETYDDAEKALHGCTLAKPGTYTDLWEECKGNQFDACLFDLMLPASVRAQREKDFFRGQQMPLGTTLAFYALACGVKYIAVVTDTNHHDHPASAAFDCFSQSEEDGVIHLGDKRVLLTNGGFKLHDKYQQLLLPFDENSFEQLDWDFVLSPEGKIKHPYEDAEDYKSGRVGLVEAKAWHHILAKLLEE